MCLCRPEVRTPRCGSLACAVAAGDAAGARERLRLGPQTHETPSGWVRTDDDVDSPAIVKAALRLAGYRGGPQ